MNRVTRTATLLTLVMCAADPASAQRTATPQDLGVATLESLLNIQVTTATRTSEGLSDAPARVQVVTAEQIQQRGYRSLADVLKDLSDFKIDVAGDQDYPTELTVQGTRGASRIVLLLDGIRISSPTNEPLPILANYPVHSARQIEIVYGPASALYGADAFSAVINIISKTVDDAPGVATSVSGGQFGLYNQTASLGLTVRPNVTLTVAGQLFLDSQPDLSKYYPGDFRGLTSHRTGVFNTVFGPVATNSSVSPEYDVPLSAHSVHAGLRAGGLHLMLFESHSRASTTPAYDPDNAVYNADAFNRNELLVTSVSYTRPIGRVTSLSTVTYSRHELDPQSGYWNIYSNLKKSYKYAFGRMAKAEEQLSWQWNPSLSVVTGGTFEHFFAIPQGADLNAPLQSHDTPGTILDTNITDELVKLRYSNTGAFGQLQYTIAPPVTLTLGARADYNTRYGSTFNPRAGVVIRPVQGTTLKALYGSAFLAPSPFQAYAHWGGFQSTDGGQTYSSSYWHLPNPDLKPQKKRTVELDLLQDVGPYLRLSASAVISDLTNLVKESDADQSYSGTYRGWPVDYIVFAVNEGHAHTYAGTVGIDFVRVLSSDRRVAAHAAVTVADGRIWEEETPSQASAPVGSMVPVQLRFSTDLDWRRWSVSPRVSVVGRQRLEATVGEGSALKRRTLRGYTTLDVNVRRHSILRNIGAFLTIENALDARYRTINARAHTNPEELIGAPQNPRRISIGFDLRIK